jgi:hypothetical protein
MVGDEIQSVKSTNVRMFKTHLICTESSAKSTVQTMQKGCAEKIIQGLRKFFSFVPIVLVPTTLQGLQQESLRLR